MGTRTWANPGNVTASDDSRATVSGDGESGGTSHYLKVTFDLSGMPSYSSIDGIQLSVEGSRSSAGTGSENIIRLTKNGTVGGDNKSTGASLATTTDAVVTYGATNDTWSLSFTSGDTIGAVLSYNVGASTAARIDYVSITITYTTAVVAILNKVVSIFGLAWLIPPTLFQRRWVVQAC